MVFCKSMSNLKHDSNQTELIRNQLDAPEYFRQQFGGVFRKEISTCYHIIDPCRPLLKQLADHFHFTDSYLYVKYSYVQSSECRCSSVENRSYINLTLRIKNNYVRRVGFPQEHYSILQMHCYPNQKLTVRQPRPVQPPAPPKISSSAQIPS